MSYCTKICLGNGQRLDLFTASMFRLRMPKLHTEEIPEIYDIPFAVGHTDDWAEVPYTLQEEGAFYTVLTDEIAIYVRKQAHDHMTMLMVKDLDGNSLYPSGEDRYGMFQGGCIVFDSANFFFEPTRCDRVSKWFYNHDTGLYDIFLEDGEIYDLYFIYGKTYKEGYAKFSTLVGPEPMLTKKGYGFYQTQFLGEKGTQTTVMRTVEEFRKRNIPLDTFIIDLDWGDGVVDGKGATWGDGIDWDKNFQTPLSVPQMLAELKEQNVEVMLIHHSIPKYEHRCNEGWVQHEYDADLWWQKMKENAQMGVIGTWQDTRQTDITDARIYKGLQDIMGNKRCTFLGNYELWQNCCWTKATQPAPYDQRIGGRRTPFRWTGDHETVGWEELKFQIKGITNIHGALKGVSYITNDASVARETDLAVRSIQFLCFTPVVRSHNSKPWHPVKQRKDILTEMMAIEADNRTVSPESSVEHLLQLTQQNLDKQAGITNILNLRYRLIPYIYSLAHEAYATGLPFTRPMLVEFPQDELCNQNQFPYQYMFGEALLVAPVYDNSGKRKVYLPEGFRWYDFFTGEILEGGQVVTADTTDLMKLPLFVKEGSIIPLQDERQWMAHGEKYDHLELLYYPGKPGTYTLYEDDGVTLDYQKGAFATTRFTVEETSDGLRFSSNKPQGDLSVLPETRRITLRVAGGNAWDFAMSPADGFTATFK